MLLNCSIGSLSNVRLRKGYVCAKQTCLPNQFVRGNFGDSVRACGLLLAQRCVHSLWGTRRRATKQTTGHAFKRTAIEPLLLIGSRLAACRIDSYRLVRLAQSFQWQCPAIVLDM